MTLFWSIIAILFFLSAILFCFMPRGWSAILAFAGMLCCKFGADAMIDSSQLWFWGAAAVIVLAIGALLPVPVVTSRRGVAYVCVAVIAGLLVGLAISPNAMILGGAVGAFIGAFAYSHTPAGAKLVFPSRQFVNYLCAKALPPLISLSIVATALVSFAHHPHNIFMN